jgi:hypothetical protein
MSAVAESATTPQGISWESERSRWSKPAAALLIAFCLAATVVTVAAAAWGARNPFLRYPSDGQLMALSGVWALGLVMALLLGRARVAITLAWSVVALVGLAAALLGGFLWSMMAAIWIVLLAAAWGDLLLRAVLRGAPAAGVDRIAFGVPLGFAALGTLFFALAVAQALAFWSVNGTLLLLTAGVILVWRRGGFPRPLLGGAGPPGRLEAFALGAAALFFVGGLLLAIAPETKYDGLNYQLAMPAHYIQHGGVIENPWNFRFYWFGVVTMIWAAGLQVAGQPTPQVIHLLMGVVFVVQTYAAGTRFLGRHVGWVAALLVATTPVVQDVAGTTYIDVFAATFAFGAIYAAVVWFEQRTAGWMVVLGILAGASLSAKLNAIVILAPIALLVVAAALLERPRSLRESLLSLVAGAASAGVVALPWFALRWVWTGNPVFPFLNNIFQSPLWPAENARFDWDTFGTGTGLVALLRLPWDITTNTMAFGQGHLTGATGALFLLSLPLFLLVCPPARRSSVLMLALMIFGGLIAWFLTSPYVRYGIALFPGLAVLAAGNLVCAYCWMTRTRLAPAISAAALIAGGAYLWATAASAAVSHWEHPRRYPISLAFGQQTPEEFLIDRLPYYRSYQWLNATHDPDLRVLGIGTPYSLYLDGFIFEEDGNTGLPGDPLLRLPQDDPAALAKAVREAGIDYLLVAKDAGTEGGYIPRNPLLIDHERFLDVYGQRLYVDNAFAVYSLKPMTKDRNQADRDSRSQRRHRATSP